MIDFRLLYVIIIFAGFKVISSSHKLQPYDGKLLRTVLRREWGSNALDLPGVKIILR